MRIYYIYRKFGINLTVSFWLQLYTMKNLILFTRVRCGFIFKARRVQVWVLESWVILLYNFGLFNVNNYIEIENNSNFHLLYCLILFNNYVEYTIWTFCKNFSAAYSIRWQLEAWSQILSQLNSIGWTVVQFYLIITRQPTKG